MHFPALMISLVIMGFISSQQLQMSDYYFDTIKVQKEINNIELIRTSIIEHYNRTGGFPSELGELKTPSVGVNNNWGKDEFDNDMVLISSMSNQLISIEYNSEVVEKDVVVAVIKKGFNGTFDSVTSNVKITILGDDEYYAFTDYMILTTDRFKTKNKIKICQSALDAYNQMQVNPKLTDVSQLYDNNLGVKFIDPIDTYDSWGNKFVVQNNVCGSVGVDGEPGGDDDFT